MNLSLTPAESQLLNLFTDCAKWIDSTNALKLLPDLPEATGSFIDWKQEQDQLKDNEREKVVLRVAGGWVRDKLLGRPSDDIDISTYPYPLTGFAFAELLRTYCVEVINQPDYVGKLTKIDANPTQSKHLETATVPILGFSVDFVQLRGGEVYDQGSRIPNAVQFGTPLEDANRRDLTINSLFYNLHSHQIEDHTNLGLTDLGFSSTPNSPILENRLIRTPLEPFQTFRDDPLRVIRAVRFASRLGSIGFNVDEGIRDAIQRDEIRDALRDSKKISRERVGAEVFKMLRGPDPLHSLSLIDSLNLHPLIFLYEPSDLVPPIQTKPEYHLTKLSAEILTSFLSSTSNSALPKLHPLLTFTPTEDSQSPSDKIANTPLNLSISNEIKRMYLSCGLLPLYHLMGVEGKVKKSVWVGDKIVKEGVKGTNADRIWSVKARESSMLLAEGVRKFTEEGRMEEGKDREEIGLLLRNPVVHDVAEVLSETRGSTWNMSLLWSLVVELTRASPDLEKSKQLIKRYNQFIDLVLSFELNDRAFDKPLLNGKELNILLPSTKNSPLTTQILSLIVRYQIGNPTATKESCGEWLVNGEGREEVEVLFKSNPVTRKAPQKKRKELP